MRPSPPPAAAADAVVAPTPTHECPTNATGGSHNNAVPTGQPTPSPTEPSATPFTRFGNNGALRGASSPRSRRGSRRPPLRSSVMVPPPRRIGVVQHPFQEVRIPGPPCSSGRFSANATRCTHSLCPQDQVAATLKSIIRSYVPASLCPLQICRGCDASTMATDTFPHYYQLRDYAVRAYGAWRCADPPTGSFPRPSVAARSCGGAKRCQKHDAPHNYHVKREEIEPLRLAFARSLQFPPILAPCSCHPCPHTVLLDCIVPHEITSQGRHLTIVIREKR
jgi:hypothetical protein